MENQISKKIIQHFHNVCIFLTLALTFKCLEKFIRNDDVSRIGFVHFNDDEGKPYPSLTICFWNPFLNEVLKTYGSGINTTTYSQFLLGELWDERMLNIDYDAVTVSLEDYMLEIGVQYGNFTIRTWSKQYNNLNNIKDVPNIHITNRDGGSKCYTFTLPYVHNVPVISFFARINKDIFPRGTRSSYPKFNGQDITEGGFTSFFHLPGQHYRSYFDKMYSWEDRTNRSKNYDMLYTIKHIEVLKHRSKTNKPCNYDWRKDGEVVMHEIVKNVGCKPSHWKINSTFIPCSSRAQMKQFKWPSYNELENILPPCQVIEKIQVDYTEMDVLSNSGVSDTKTEETGWFRINLYFPETSFKEISQTQAYDIESFVGNAGGYLGLFLGYSLVCIPKWILHIIGRAKKHLTSYFQGKLDNLENQISSVTMDNIKRSKENKEFNTVIERNMPCQIQKINSNIKLLKSKQKELEKKIEHILMNYSDGMEIQLKQQSHTVL